MDCWECPPRPPLAYCCYYWPLYRRRCCCCCCCSSVITVYPPDAPVYCTFALFPIAIVARYAVAAAAYDLIIRQSNHAADSTRSLCSPGNCTNYSSSTHSRWLALSRTLLLFADRIRWAPKINQNCFSLALLFVVGHVLCTFRTSSFGWVVVVILPTTPLAQIDHLVDERVAIH